MALPLGPTLAFALITLLALYKYIIHPAFLSSLSAIPAAHWSARYTSLWILFQRYHSRNNATTLTAHDKYGSIVLLGPSEISLNCVDGGIRTVYAGGFEKSDWYPRLFPSYGVINMFSTVGHTEHSAKKRSLSNVYSKSYLQSSAQVATNSKLLLVERFLPLIEGFAESGEIVEVHDVNNAFTMDFMSAYQFGLANSTNFTQDVQTRKRTLHEYHCRKEYEFYHQEIPWFRDLTKRLGMPIVPKFCDAANENFEVWNSSMCNGAEKLLQEESIKNLGDEPVVYKQFRSGFLRLMGNEKATQHPETFKAEVASEMLDHLGAGHETSAIALTYLYYELSKRPALQVQLRTEVLSLDPPISWPPPSGMENFELPSPKTIDSLPFLHATLMETLRLHASIPGMQPRITPKGGCTLAGYANIPVGIRVSAMPYTLHRNADVFPDPLAFKPERWLDANENQMKEMLRWFWAFGSGGRMCIGSHLAIQEMKLIVASIYGNWRTEIMNDEGIEEIDAYTTRPRRNALDLRFVKV